MVGNVSEWVAEWDTAVGPAMGLATRPWPLSAFGDDVVTNVVSAANSGGGSGPQGLIAAMARGGEHGNGTGAGVFAVRLDMYPGSTTSGIGFRCVIPR